MKVSFETNPEGFQPYKRNENLSRPWAIPGTKGLEHRIGGLEKQNVTGNVNYEPDNHQLMVDIRANKIKNIQNDIPDLEVIGDESGELLVLAWGSTGGSAATAVENLQAKGINVSYAIMKYMYPMPKNTGGVLSKFKKVLIPEINLGQLSRIIRAEFLINPFTYNVVKGLPMKAYEIENKIEEILKAKN